MASVEECEKLRGAAEVKLQKEIQKLRKACEVEAPNKRLVANLVASLDKAWDNLINSHVDLVKMNAQLNEPRLTQYLCPLVDAVEEVKAVAEVVTRTIDGDGVPNSQVDSESLKEDYARMVLSTEDVNLESAYDSGYAVLGLHPVTEAEKEKLSEEVHKQCKDEVTNNCTREDVEQCKYGETTRYASQVCESNNLKV